MSNQFLLPGPGRGVGATLAISVPLWILCLMAVLFLWQVFVLNANLRTQSELVKEQNRMQGQAVSVMNRSASQFHIGALTNELVMLRQSLSAGNAQLTQIAGMKAQLEKLTNCLTRIGDPRPGFPTEGTLAAKTWELRMLRGGGSRVIRPAIPPGQPVPPSVGDLSGIREDLHRLASAFDRWQQAAEKRSGKGQ
jgi:hypothetical protein